jgi:hypothetical protein
MQEEAMFPNLSNIGFDPVKEWDEISVADPEPNRLIRFPIGSGSSQKLRILPDLDPVPDPQHWMKSCHTW